MAKFLLKQLPTAIIVLFLATIFEVAESRNCGRRPLFLTANTQRIMAGVNARVGELPWQAYIRNVSERNNVICGASIIHKKWILTAAHCFADVERKNIKRVLRVVASNIHLSNDTWNTNPRKGYNVQVKKIKRVWIHESYDELTVYNDIALLELTTPLHFDDFTQPICLPKQSDNFNGRHCTVAGFGRRGYSEIRFGMHLEKMDLPVINMARCGSLSGLNNLEKTICTTSTQFPSGKNKAICIGESGGPLACVSDHDGRFVVAGLATWDYPECQGPVSAFADVVAFLPWIRRTMKNVNFK